MGFCKDKVAPMFYYSTVKLVEIQNWKLGLLHHTIQLVILLYVIGFVIIYNKEYQSEDAAVGYANAKVKGNGYTLVNNEEEIWDEYDTVYPPTENNAFFVITKYHTTPHQQRGICPGSKDCGTSCPKGKMTRDGRATGKCNAATNKCEIRGWCPAEPSHFKDNQIQGVEDLTVFVKVNVKFPTFGIAIDNVGLDAPRFYNNKNKKDKDNRFANLWTLGEMVNLTNNDLSSLHEGAVMALSYTWNCDFDRNKTGCVPQKSWIRLDNPKSFSKGFNFRYTRTYYEQNRFNKSTDPVLTRDLVKVRGIKFIILISGVGRKFTSPIPFFQALGAGLGLLAVATVVADFLLIFVVPRKNRYKHAKIEEVEDQSTDFENMADSIHY